MKTVFLSTAVALLLGSSLPVLGAGDVTAGQAKAAVCASCHGPDGNSTNPQWPNLAGQHAAYVAKQLADFKAGVQRSNAMMAPMVAGLTDQDMQDLAAYYAAQAPSGGFTSEAHVELGRRVYLAGIAERGIAACTACHGPRGSGNPNGGFPVLAGQHATYTAAQLRAFRSKERANDGNGMMRDTARWLTDEEIEAVSAYIAGLH